MTTIRLVNAVLDVIDKLTQFEEFYNIKYKRKEIQDLLDDCVQSDMVTTEIQEKSKKILNNLNKKLNN